MGWIGVDLDGCLAHYVSGDIEKFGVSFIGAPIPLMVKRVKQWLAEGREVRIFTARVCDYKGKTRAVHRQILLAIKSWSLEHLGRVLPVTCQKDFHMIELWDDRCVQVITNTGERVGYREIGPLPAEAQEIEL